MSKDCHVNASDFEEGFIKNYKISVERKRPINHFEFE